MEKSTREDIPACILKVRRHHKHAYVHLANALKIDEKEDLDVDDQKEVVGLYEKGAHELKAGIAVQLNGQGEDYDRARKLQNKMESNLEHAESRVIDLIVSIESVSIKTDEINKDTGTTKPMKPSVSGTSSYNGVSSCGSKSKGNGAEQFSNSYKKPSVSSTRKAIPSTNLTKRTNRRAGPKEPSADQTTTISKLKNVDSKHANLILNEVVEKGKGVTFDDIGGMKNAKQILHEIVVLPALRPELFTGLRAPARGLLLFGPPGNGKTLLAKAVASEANAVFFNISAASLTSKFVGEGEKMVKAMFAVARELQPAIIFIDEIDSLLCERKESEHEASRRLKTEFLVGFDGVISDTDERILIMGATNRPWELDDAALRRMVKRVHVPLPDHETRYAILKKMLSKQSKVSLTDHDFNKISRITEGYSGSDLAALARDAALMPIRDLTPTEIESLPADKVRGIALNDFELAMRTIRPSVSRDHLQQFSDWNDMYGALT